VNKGNIKKKSILHKIVDGERITICHFSTSTFYVFLGNMLLFANFKLWQQTFYSVQEKEQ